MSKLEFKCSFCDRHFSREDNQYAHELFDHNILHPICSVPQSNMSKLKDHVIEHLRYRRDIHFWGYMAKSFTNISLIELAEEYGITDFHLRRYDIERIAKVLREFKINEDDINNACLSPFMKEQLIDII